MCAITRKNEQRITKHRASYTSTR